MKKNILITGGTGFVGRNIVEHFCAAPDCNVISPSTKELDLLDDNSVRKYVVSKNPDIVIHCANRGGTRKTAYDTGNNDVVTDNVRMFFNLVRSLPKHARMINMGTGAEYDRRNYVPKMSESYFDSFVPADAYGYSKYVISKYIEKSENICCLRIFGIFGKYEDYTFRFISNSIVKNLLGLPIVINQNSIFDYLYIEDFVRLLDEFVAHKPVHTHYNVTPTKSIDLVSLAGLVNSFGKTKSDIHVLNPGMNREYTGNNIRLKTEFPDFDCSSYEVAVKELYEYYRVNLNSLNLSAVKADPYLKNCVTKL